jgi:prephenate dehydrogenase
MTIAIVGPGLIGHSIALALQHQAAAAEAGTAAPPAATPTIIEIDRGDSIERVRGASIVILATPVDVILRILHVHGHLLRDAIVTDTGSTKRAIVAAARAAGLRAFVGGHPLAGGERGGRQHARADLFHQRPWFLVPDGAPAEAVSEVSALVTRVGARPVLCSDDGAEHDHVMAAVSHLPQVVASALIKIAGDAAGDNLTWAGAGLRDTTRLAASPADVWESILATNADATRPLLYLLADELRQVADGLEGGSAVRALFEKANHYRALL